MAMPVSVLMPIVGVDVAKNELVIFQAELDLLETIPNNKTAIKQWLKGLPGAVEVAIESTNISHRESAVFEDVKKPRRLRAGAWCYNSELSARQDKRCAPPR